MALEFTMLQLQFIFVFINANIFERRRKEAHITVRINDLYKYLRMTYFNRHSNGQALLTLVL